jgi:Zn-dependent protease
LVLVALAGILGNIGLGILIAVALSHIPLSAQDQVVLVNCQPHLTGFAIAPQGGLLQSCLAGWQPGWLLRVEQFAYIFAGENIALGLLNLVPLYPLDGYHILFALLPDRTAIGYRNSEQWQELILAAIIFFVPFLLSLAQFPFNFNPLVLLQGVGYSIVDGFAGPTYAESLSSIFFNL